VHLPGRVGTAKRGNMKQKKPGRCEELSAAYLRGKREGAREERAEIIAALMALKKARHNDQTVAGTGLQAALDLIASRK